MRALVTGATGFVGSHLVAALQARGDTVTVLVRSPQRASGLDWHDVTLVPGTLHDLDALAVAVRDQEVIFHVAGRIAAPDERAFIYANLEGTANLLAAARGSRERPRFVYLSSLAAAGPTVAGAPLSGTEAPHPVSQYGRSKLAAEEAVRSSRLSWTIVRPPMVYGPRDREILRVFRLARGGLAPLFGDGRQELSAIYVVDLAAALIAVAMTEATQEACYVACHPEIFTSGEFVQAVGVAITEATGRRSRRVRVVNIPEPVARTLLRVTGTLVSLAGRATLLTADKANELFAPAWTGDPAPLTRDTGWRATQGLSSGLALTAHWYHGAGWL